MLKKIELQRARAQSFTTRRWARSTACRAPGERGCVKSGAGAYLAPDGNGVKNAVEAAELTVMATDATDDGHPELVQATYAAVAGGGGDGGGGPGGGRGA